MSKIKIKGYEYDISLTKNSFNRRTIQYTNSIIKQFKLIGLTNDDIEINEERMPIRKIPANVSWWINNYHCYYSFNKMSKYVDNLLVILKVIEHYIDQIITEEISIEEFIEIFEEKDDIEEKRIEAKKFFGLEKDHVNLDIINKKYKALAKTLHPDMSNGDINKFKELNKYHKILKRELE